MSQPGYTLQIKADKALKMLGLLSNKQISYAAAAALNDTAKAIQKEVRFSVARKLVLRSKKEFVLRQSAIIKFAKGTMPLPEASVRVGNKKGLLLPLLETGGERRPKNKLIAAPIIEGARPSLKADIPTEYLVKNLRLKRKKKKTDAANPFYMTPDGIWERGRDRRDNKLLYAFRKIIRVPQRLGFMQMAKRVAGRTAKWWMLHHTAKAVSYSLGKGPPVSKASPPPEVE